MTKTIAFALLVSGTVAPIGVALAQPVSDHLDCYRVKDPAGRKRFSVTLTNAGGTQTCTATTPAAFGCLASQVTAIAPPAPGTGPSAGAAFDFLCYRVKCPKGPRSSAETTDELGGSRVVVYRNALHVCMPASRAPAPVGTSTTTTTLAGAGQCEFDQHERRCTGTCGDGGHCSAVASGGDCECRTTACGDADAPECNGFCSPGEACIFTLTECSCVNIP
jgi:hypothetical protein